MVVSGMLKTKTGKWVKPKNTGSRSAIINSRAYRSRKAKKKTRA